jgi:lysozyme
MNWTKLEEDLIRDEGLRLRRYPCSKGHPTIGVGHKLRPHEQNITEISLTEAGRLLRLDIQHAIDGLENVFGTRCMDRWSERRQRALVNMMFNLGETRFRGFKRMIKNIELWNWALASVECLDSAYARQVGKRAERVAKAIREG